MICLIICSLLYIFVTKLKQKNILVAMPRRSILHLNHSLFFVWSSLEHETCQLLEIVTINYFPFSMHFLCHKVMNFLRESWRNYICTIFFPRERLVRTREFCSCYYNFPLLYVLEWSKSWNISTELAKLPYFQLSFYFVTFS